MHHRFQKFNSKYIQNIKIVWPIQTANFANYAPNMILLPKNVHLYWVVPEKIHTPTEEIFAVRRGREEKCLRMSEGGERKNVLGCPKGGRGMWICLSEGLRLS